MSTQWMHDKRFKYIAWLVILFWAMVGIYAYTHRGNGGKKPEALRPAVEVTTMKKQDMMKRVILSGETVPKASVDISPKYGGRIASISVDLGSRVHQGDVLLTQDTKDVLISIQENSAGSDQAAAEAVESRSTYEAGTMKAQSDYDNARTTYERYQTLFEQGAVSMQERDDKYRAMMEAKSALDSLTNQMVGGSPAVIAAKNAAAAKARYTVDALEAQAEDMTLVSPIDGIIGYRQAEVGQWATSGQKLLTVVDNSHLYMDCDVAEQDMTILREGLDVDVDIDSLGDTVAGKLIYISPSIDASTRSYRVRLELDASSGKVRGGMFGQCDVTAVQRKDTLFLPKAAVVDDNGKKSVFVITSDGKAKKVAVRLGLANDDFLEIKKGLSEGDQVAVTNISKLKDGMTVDVIHKEA